MACRCAPALVALRREVDVLWPGRDRASDGCCGDAAHALRKSDHNPDKAGYAHALDIDEDIAVGLGSAPLLTLKGLLLRDPRTKYVIYERRIAYPDGTDKPYSGPNAHEHHLHLSIKAGSTYDTGRWLLPAPKDEPAPPPPALPHEESFLMTVARDDDDARRALVRQWFHLFLGRGPGSTDEMNLHVYVFATSGADRCLTGIVDSPEGQAFARGRRAAYAS